MSIEADLGVKVDELLLRIKAKSKPAAKSQGGIASLLLPLKNELEYTRIVANKVRQDAIRKMLQAEMKQYDCELREKGLCISPFLW